VHSFTESETAAAFARYDVNGDGVLQRHEVRASYLYRLARFDRHKQGYSHVVAV